MEQMEFGFMRVRQRACKTQDNLICIAKIARNQNPL
jgi:hypothetical protein